MCRSYHTSTNNACARNNASAHNLCKSHIVLDTVLYICFHVYASSAHINCYSDHNCGWASWNNNRTAERNLLVTTSDPRLITTQMCLQPLSRLWPDLAWPHQV